MTDPSAEQLARELVKTAREIDKRRNLETRRNHLITALVHDHGRSHRQVAALAGLSHTAVTNITRKTQP